MGSVLLISTADSLEDWTEGLSRLSFPMPLKVWPDVGDPAEIRYAIASKPPLGELAKLPNLKAILSLWAGVDHLTRDPDLPKVPIVRMIDPGLTQGMREFVLSQVMDLHLCNYDFLETGRRPVWDNSLRGHYGHEPLIADRTVGILGLGAMGAAVADQLTTVGFRVLGWSRRQKTLAGGEALAGADGFERILREADILVNLLPLTEETRDILNADTFARMKTGASLINVGRGEHVVEADLIAALDDGRLHRAVLDVFRTEPLPTEHPFWYHPSITVFPHIASITRIDTGGRVLIDNLNRLEAGEPVAGLYDPEAGY